MTTDSAGTAATGPAPSEGRGLAVPALLAVVGLAGAATMVIELGAVRLLAPWFGTSSSVWTNVIGVVLAALALGYATGARLALGRSPLRSLGLTLLVGAACAAWLPCLAPLVGDAFMPTGVALHGAATLLVWGSLAAAILLFLPAATALGCAGPLAVEVLQRRRGGPAGRAGGHVLAVSTIGSLAGTFGTTHLFVPVFGITRTFLLAAAVLAVCGAVLFAASRRGGRAAVPAALVVFALAGAIASWSAPRTRASAASGDRELARVESAVQSLRVIERGEGPDRLRLLQVNEALDSFQSVWQPESGLLPPGHYYDHFALPYAWTAREAGEPPASWDLFVVGLGGGTAVRVLQGVVADETRFASVGVELDPAVVELGERYFELESDGEARVVVGGLDGRAALRLSERRFDQVILDAYANNMEIPSHLASVEAFRAARERLVDGGWLTVNIGGFGLDDPVVRAVASAAARGMESDVHVARVAFSRNLTLFARRGREVPSPGTSEFGSRGAALIGDVGALLSPLEVEGAWATLRLAEADADAPTDDTAALEELQVRSIRAAESRRRAIEDVARSADAEGAPTAELADGDADLLDAARSLAGRGELAGALQAAGEVEALGPRAALEAELLWRAGDPLRALEVASNALGAGATDLSLVRIAVDLGLVLEASELSEDLLGDLRTSLSRADLGAEAHAWWGAEVERLEPLVASARERRRAQAAALSRSRLVSLLGLAGVSLWLVWAAGAPGASTA
ncbi:MAG: fused MFS/spermidine synthase [Planctomycetota bacterium]